MPKKVSEFKAKVSLYPTHNETKITLRMVYIPVPKDED